MVPEMRLAIFSNFGGNQLDFIFFIFEFYSAFSLGISPSLETEMPLHVEERDTASRRHSLCS